MNIAIVGAGITGISTALELARDGHQVTVYEQMNATAEEASFAPGGWLSPCVAPSLSAPGVGMPLKQLQKGSGLLQASTFLGSNTWRWMRQWKKHEKQALKQGAHPLFSALQALSSYSQDLRWQDCEDPESIAEQRPGALILLRNPQELEFWQQRLPLLQEHGIACQLLSPQQALSIEPSLGQDIAWLSALHFPQGESINPRLWTHLLRMQAQHLGAHFHTGVPIQRISTQPLGVQTAQQLHLHDAIVLCTGAHQQLSSQALGLQLPLMTNWGYSVTAPVRDALQAPRGSVMDWAQQATITRMGQRVRITAGLELDSTANAPHHTATLQRMYRLLNDWFPGGALLSSPQVQVWRGVRGHLPDGLPAVGASGRPGVWLNLAHGSHGASLAAGCARALADMLAGRPTAIDMQAFSPLRF